MFWLPNIFIREAATVLVVHALSITPLQRIHY